MSQRLPSILRAAAASAALVAIGCGSNGISPATDLNAVFNKTMATSPVVTSTLLRQNGNAIAGAQLTVDTRSTFKGWLSIGTVRTATTNASGVASISLPNNTYPVSTAQQTATLIGALHDSLVVSGDTSRTWQTSQQAWTVTAPKNFKALHISIYQTDASGRALYSLSPNAADPLILDANVTVPGGNAGAASLTFNTELFQGTYRAVIRVTPAVATDTLAPFETAVFNAAGAGATETAPAVALVASDNVITLQLMDSGAAIAAGQIGTIEAFDHNSLISLGTTPYVAAGTKISTGSVTDVVVQVNAADGSLMAMQPMSGTVTLNRYAVSGKVKTPNGAAIVPVSGYYGTVNAYLQTNLGEPWATAIAGVPSSPAPISDATGTYSMKLIAGSYNVRAEQVPSLPTAANVGIAVAAAVPAQDVGVDAGGTITGTVQDTAQANVANVAVLVYDSTHTAIGQATTNASGNFSVAVPYGTYDVFVAGALSGSPNVNASASTANLTLTQFSITGRLVDAQANGVAARVRWGGNVGGVATSTTTPGSYTIKVVQGLNWFQFTPTGTATFGLAYEPLVQVDANTFKSLP